MFRSHRGYITIIFKQYLFLCEIFSTDNLNELELIINIKTINL